MRSHIGNARHSINREIAAGALRLRYEGSHEEMFVRLAEAIEAPDSSHQLIIEYLSFRAEAGIFAVVVENAVDWITQHPYAATGFLFQFEDAAIDRGVERNMWFLLDMG